MKKFFSISLPIAKFSKGKVKFESEVAAKDIAAFLEAKFAFFQNGEDSKGSFGGDYLFDRYPDGRLEVSSVGFAGEIRLQGTLLPDKRTFVFADVNSLPRR